MRSNYVKVDLYCHNLSIPLRFHIEVTGRAVPEPLRAEAPGGGGGGLPTGLCPECQRLLQNGRLKETVHQLILRGWADHIREGSVIVRC